MGVAADDNELFQITSVLTSPEDSDGDELFRMLPGVMRQRRATVIEAEDRLANSGCVH